MNYKCTNCGKIATHFDVQMTSVIQGKLEIIPAWINGEPEVDFVMNTNGKSKVSSIYTCPNCAVVVTTDSERARKLLLRGRKKVCPKNNIG